MIFVMKKLAKVWGMPLVLALLVLASGCQTVQQNEESQEVKPLPFTKLSVPKADQFDESPLGVEQKDLKEEKEQAERKITIPSRTQSSRPKAEVSDYPKGIIKGITDPEAMVSFEINLDNAQITEMVSLFADKDVLNFSYLVDPAVKGAVTVNIKTEMKAKDIWATMQHLLWLSGAYASPSTGFINILPFDKMPKERKLFASHDVQPNVEVLFIPIKYRKSADIINLVKPFMTDGATATDLADSNTVLIVEAPANCEKLQELIKYLDNKGEQEWPVRCFQCHEIDSDTVANELQVLMPVLGMPIASSSGPSGGAIKITSLPRLGSIVVSASLEEVLDEVGVWMKILDRSDMMDKEEIFFYNVRHSKAASLTAALETFFNCETTTNSTSSNSGTSRSSRSTSIRTSNMMSGSSRSNTNSNSNRTNSTNSSSSNRTTGTTNNRNNTSNTNRSSAANRIASSSSNANGSSTLSPLLETNIFETEVTVFSDDESNRLTVKTTPRTWNLIKAFLERQDVPPRQVSIRAIITDISLTKNTEYGVSYSINKLLGSDDQDSLSAMMNTAGVNPTQDMELSSLMTSSGIGFLYKDSQGDPLVFVKAVAGDGNTKILSEPHILALSGATAKISVGKKIAVPTESTTYTSSDNMRTNYEYVETGIIMEVTPYITAGNEVRLEISQEVSSAEQQTDKTIPPTIVNKELSTEMVVPDNSTLIMGGMIQNDLDELNSGIPFIKDIPWIGRLFRYNYETKARTELLVLLTVNVVDSKNPQEQLVRRYKASLEEIEKANRDSNLY